MSDENKSESATPRTKTLSLNRTVESRQVRQNFARGRSKSVVVEKKRRRIVTKTDDGKNMQASPDVQERQDDDQIRILSKAEQDARNQAVSQARERAREDAQRREADATRRAEENSRRAAEKKAREAEEAHIAEALARKKETKQKRETKNETKPASPTPDIIDVPAAPLSDKAALRPVARRKESERDNEQSKRSHAPRGERRRREGKLTIHDALNDEERVRSLASIKRRREREKRQARDAEPVEKISRSVTIPETITIQELANRMAERAVDVIKILMQQGVIAKINDVIDADTAQLIAEELGHSVKRVAESDVETGISGGADDAADMRPRPAVVTVMGHVDHGKTSLLDAIRNARIAAGEAGGITQHIGAYQVETKSGGVVTFIDTPGHAAFTTMRARGAKVTDIVVLVVAGDDGVMPQTIEAINHAKAANAPIIVAINKMDKENADPTRVKNDLLQHEIISEEMGGDTQMVELSAKTGAGVDDLLEAILLQAELMDLKANPDREAEGVVIEAQLDRGRGAVATILLQRGTLHNGDAFVVGQESGRVRALVNDQGKQIKQAGPSMAIEVLGASGAPQAGDIFNVVENEARAREVAEYRNRKARDNASVSGARASSLDQMLKQLQDSDQIEFPLIVKGDVQGSVEAISQAMQQLGNDEIQARIVLSGVGGITESDVTLASASAAVVIGFNTRANAQARNAAARTGVEIRYYNIIYDLVDDMRAAMAGMLSPDLRETMLGNAEILEIFTVGKGSKAAGARVRDGILRRGAKVRLIRDDVVIHEGDLSSLRRFKDEVKDVNAGQECGTAFENYADLKPGDIIECYEVEEVARKLED